AVVPLPLAAVALQPTLAQLVLLIRRQAPQALVGFARGTALLGRHVGPLADALVEALALDRLQRGIAARRGDEALLLVARKAVPIRADGAEHATLVRRQGRPRHLGDAAVLGVDAAGSERQHRREDQGWDLPSHERKSWSRKASGGSSWVRSWASRSPRSVSFVVADLMASIARSATSGTHSSERWTTE